MKYLLAVMLLVVSSFVLGSAALAQNSTPVPSTAGTGTPAPTATPAPDACRWSLTSVYSLLANAQVAWESGNARGALNAAAAAQGDLDHLVALCSGQPTAAEPAKSGAIAAIASNSKSYTKLAALAWTHGLDLRITDKTDEFVQMLQTQDVAAALVLTSMDDDRVLLSVDKFVRSGGTAMLFARVGWVDFSPLLQKLFGFGMVAEEVHIAQGSIQLDDSSLPPYLTGLRVGVQGRWNVGLRRYLVLPDTNGVQRVLKSEKTGRSRVVYYGDPHGKLMVSIPADTVGSDGYNTFWQSADWFDNDNIEFFENEAAALAMLTHLSGGTVVPSVPSSQSGQRPVGLTDAQVQRFTDVQKEVAAGGISKDQANKDLATLAGEIGKDAFGWLVRNIPTYNTRTKQWQTVDQYTKDLARDTSIDPASRLAKDPVGVGLDLVLGNPSSDDMLNWLGLSK